MSQPSNQIRLPMPKTYYRLISDVELKVMEHNYQLLAQLGYQRVWLGLSKEQREKLKLEHGSCFTTTDFAQQVNQEYNKSFGTLPQRDQYNDFIANNRNRFIEEIKHVLKADTMFFVKKIKYTHKPPYKDSNQVILCILTHEMGKKTATRSDVFMYLEDFNKIQAVQIPTDEALNVNLKQPKEIAI